MTQKNIIILGDGMADEPIPALGNKTPLQAAYTPYMNLLACKGRNGLLHTVPDGFAPGSEIANLSVLGYDLPSVFEGRGVLEAARSKPSTERLAISLPGAKALGTVCNSPFLPLRASRSM